MRDRAAELRRDRVWRHDEVARAIGAAGDAIDAHEAGLAAALDAVDVRLRARRRIGAWLDELDVFATAAAALRRSAGSDPARDRARTYFRVATRTLHRVGIAARGSRLSFLHDELRRDLARSDRPSAPAWHESLEDDGRAATLTRMLEAELRPAEPLELVRLRLARARVLRLGGALDAAAQLLHELAIEPALRDAVAWERACIDAMATGRLDGVAASLRMQRCEPTAERLAVVKLWGYAVASKAWLASGRRAATLRRADAIDAPLGRVLGALERAYEPRWPLATRVVAVEAAHEIVDDIADVGARALAVGAIARWFARAKQLEPARLATASYRALCDSLSDGKSEDLFRLALPGAPAAARDRLPEHSRLRVASVLLASAIGRRDESARAEYAEILAAHVAALEGPSIKIAQMLGFYGLRVPLPARRILAALHHTAAVPLAFDRVRAIIEAEHRRALERTFADFDERPLATGSIGQVHRARLPNGEHVVVKVQYPGIEHRIRRDLRSLGLAVPLARALYPAWDWRGILTEIEARLVEECDYVREATHQEHFRAGLSRDPRLAIPRCHTDLTTRRVLVSDHVAGESFATFAACAPEAARASAARTLLQYVLRTAAFDRCFNTDLHPGNLLFDGTRVWLIDFGSVRRWSADEGLGFLGGVRGLLDDDVVGFERAARELGMWGGDSSEVAALFRLMRDELMVGIVGEGPRRIDVRASAESIRAFFAFRSPSGATLRLPPIYVYAYRMFWGLLAVLSALDVEVDYRSACLEVMALHDARGAQPAHEPAVPAREFGNAISAPGEHARGAQQRRA